MELENELRKIYRGPADPVSLGGIDRLFRRLQDLKLPKVTCQAVENFLKSEQPTLYIGQPEDMYAIESTSLASMPSGRLSLLTCRAFRARTWACATS